MIERTDRDQNSWAAVLSSSLDLQLSPRHIWGYPPGPWKFHSPFRHEGAEFRLLPGHNVDKYAVPRPHARLGVHCAPIMANAEERALPRRRLHRS